MSKRKLLLADDSITIQKVVNLTFADEGIEVISVSDGDSAMQKLTEVSPDLVMADVHMPGINGYQICEKIRESQGFSAVPVILLVGSFEPFDEDEAKRVGADGYLTKPFQSIRQLVNKVTNLLESGREKNLSASKETSNETVSVVENSPAVFSAPLETVSNTLETSGFDNNSTFETKPLEDFSKPLETSDNKVFTTSTENFVDDKIFGNPSFSDSGEVLETSSINKTEENKNLRESFSDYSDIKTGFDDSNLDDEMIETSQLVESSPNTLEEIANLNLIDETKPIEEIAPITYSDSTIDSFSTTQEMSDEEIKDVISKEYTADFEKDSSNDKLNAETFSKPEFAIIEKNSLEIPQEKAIGENYTENLEKSEDNEFILDTIPTVLDEHEENAEAKIAEDSTVKENLNETGFDFVNNKEFEVSKISKNLEKDSNSDSKSLDNNNDAIPLPETLTILDFDDQNLLEIVPREEDFILSETEDEELLVDDVTDISQFKSQPKEEISFEPIAETPEEKEVSSLTPIEEEISDEIEEETNTKILEEPIQEKADEISEENFTQSTIENEFEKEISEEKANIIEVEVSEVEEKIEEPAEEIIEEKADIVSEKTSTDFLAMPIISPTQEKAVEETSSETTKLFEGKLSADNISPELIELIANRVVEKLSERVIREIAWEVVPQHADLIIKKMVEEKLKET